LNLKKNSLLEKLYQPLNVFIDPKRVIKSYVLLVNAPLKMHVPIGYFNTCYPLVKR